MQNHELADAWTSKRGRSVELDVEKLRRMTMSVVSWFSAKAIRLRRRGRQCEGECLVV